MTEKNLDEGWVSMTGMAGPHKKEWWVHMVRNLQPKCLSNSNFCSFVGEILYLKDFNIIANILLFIEVVHNIIRLQYRNSSPQ